MHSASKYAFKVPNTCYSVKILSKLQTNTLMRLELDHAENHQIPSNTHTPHTH